MTAEQKQFASKGGKKKKSKEIKKNLSHNRVNSKNGSSRKLPVLERRQIKQDRVKVMFGFGPSGGFIQFLRKIETGWRSLPERKDKIFILQP